MVSFVGFFFPLKNHNESFDCLILRSSYTAIFKIFSIPAFGFQFVLLLPDCNFSFFFYFKTSVIILSLPCGVLPYHFTNCVGCFGIDLTSFETVHKNVFFLCSIFVKLLSFPVNCSVVEKSWQ